MNVEIGAEAPLFPEKGIHKWDFRCSVWWNLKYYLHIIEKKSYRCKFPAVAS